jgi:hypothetical protein
MGPYTPFLIGSEAMERANQTSQFHLSGNSTYLTSEISTPRRPAHPSVGNCEPAVYFAYRGERFTDRQSVGWRPESDTIH